MNHQNHLDMVMVHVELKVLRTFIKLLKFNILKRTSYGDYHQEFVSIVWLQNGLKFGTRG